MSYRRDMNNDRFGNNMNRGYGNMNQPPMNPWNNGGGSLLGQSPSLTDNATLLLANNLLNILSNKNQMLPSLLDVNPMQNQYSSGGMNSSYGNSSNMFNANRPNMNSRLAPLMGNFGSPQRSLNQSRFSPRAQGSSSGNGPRTGGVKRNSNQFKKGPGSANKNVKKAVNNRSNNKQSSGGGSDGNKNKRDWKDEKKDSEQKQTDQTPKKEKNETTTDQDESTTSSAAASPGKRSHQSHQTSAAGVVVVVTEYDGLDKQYYHCHICKKNMWDGQSFQKHLKGRAHLSMMSGLSDSYGMRAQMLRHEMRMAENARQIEFERKRRLGKGGYSSKKPLEFCTMCDLDFMVMGPTSHRATAGHLKLKNLLHPKCANCNVDFSNPVEYDQHLLSALHLKKMAELGIMQVSGVEEEYKSFTEQCEITGVDMKKLTKSLQNKTKAASDAKIKSETAKDAGESTKTGEDQEVDKKDADGDEQKQETDGILKNDKLIDYNENTDLTGITTANLPEYNPRSAVGMSFLEEKTCYLCNLCHVYLTDSEAVAVHARSPRHHEYFVQTVKKHLASAKAVVNETNKRNTADRDEEEQLDDDNAGHWKRRKTNMSTTSNNDTGTEDDKNEKQEEMYEPESSLFDQEHEDAADEISKLMDDVQQDEETLLLNQNLGEVGGQQSKEKQPGATTTTTNKTDKTQTDEKASTDGAEVNSSSENLMPTVVVEDIAEAAPEPVKKEEQQQQQLRSTPARRGGATAVRGNRARRGAPRRN